MKPKYIIIDWIGNVMNPKAMTNHYGVANFFPDVPQEFDSFEDAEDFLCNVLNNDYKTDRGEYYIIKKIKL